MSEQYILVFDIGTQSARAMLVDKHGDIAASKQQAYSAAYFSPKPGWSEQTPDFYWEQLCAVSRALLAENPTLKENIAAVTVSTIRDSLLLLDKELKPLRNIIVWMDDRMCEKLPPLPASVSALLKVAGLSKLFELQRRASPINWLAYDEKTNWEKADKFCLTSAYLNLKLSGRLVDSDAAAIGHIPFKNKTRTWMASGDIERMVFPKDSITKQHEIAVAGTIIGEITSAASEASGIPQKIPLVASGSDKGCETFALTGLDSEAAALSFGTTATLQITNAKYIEPQKWLPPYAAVIPGYYNPEIQIYRGYWLISWFKREFAAKEVADAEKQGLMAEDLLDQRLSEVPAGCQGLMLQPYFSPNTNMPYAKGAAIGLSDVHTRIHLYRAIIEGINFALMDGLESIQKNGKLTVKKLYLSGGGSHSAEICRITASMFNLPVSRIQSAEATGIGAAAISWLALKEFSTPEEAHRQMTRVRDTFDPNPADAQIYKELYTSVFKNVFGKLAPLYKEINRIIGI
jgi:sugar (pentulose or hexulose) kinase